ncbi:hypothetical protein KCP74_22290 [Salmonella enterica subsp. enterica]|nr:hypothetical protein KCP74_22290 [Salmonella enterica subsp. enterica]
MLHNIDLNIRQGEVVVIIGLPVQGKSRYYAVSINWKITSGDLIVDGLRKSTILK